MIDTSTFHYEGSRWHDIVNCLQGHGIECYSPGTVYGDVSKKFAIPIYYGSSANYYFNRTSDVLYDVNAYVPKKQYSWLEPFIEEIKSAMRDLEPMLKFDGYQTPSYYDDTVKCHVVSIEYVNYRFKQ